MTTPVQLAGWFSLSGAHATIGDQLALAVASAALAREGIAFELLRAGDQPDTKAVKVWICGPIDRSYEPQRQLIGDGSNWILADTTIIADRTGPGLAQIGAARDGPGVQTRADFACLASQGEGGFAALVLRGHQPEYRQAESIHQQFRVAIEEALGHARLWVVDVGTKANPFLETPSASAGIERLLASSSVVVTSRLHCVIHCLRTGVIPVIIDEIIDGGKITAMVRAFGLPIFVPAKECTVSNVSRALEQARHIEPQVAQRILIAMQASARDGVGRMLDLIKASLANA